MARPVVAIVGRPNVGKSTLFNKLIGQRLSIVDDTPGVTRDRIYGDCEWLGRNMLLVDTGGIEPYSDDIILSQMRRQAQLAVDSADVIVLVTDLRTGVVATDHEVATMLQKSGKPIVLCVNKCDTIGERPQNFMSFIISDSATRFPFLPCTVTAQATFWTPFSNCFPNRRKMRTTPKPSAWRSSANRMSANPRW